jgi:cytosine/adenosine deaminase-related metal-dependent hydrolase
LTKYLIRGGCVLTLGQRTQNLPVGDVLVEDGRIAEVGMGLRARGAETVDATDTIVMPGFVDTHRHAWKSLFRNLGGTGLPPSAYGPHYRPDDVYIATLVGLLGAVEAGVTTVVDWSDIQVDETFTEAAVQAHADAGLRTVLAYAAPAWGSGGGGLRALVGSGKPGPRTTVAYGSDDPGSANLDSLSSAWTTARELGLRIHAHVGATESETGTAATLAANGLLGSDVTLVHCTHLDDSDLDAIASTGTHVSLTPTREMNGGLGAPPLQALIDRGLRPGLGVGNELEAPGDMFAQIRAANSIQHATLFDLKLAGKAGVPNLLTTREVIRYGTVDGARAAGLGDVTGSLTVGRQADLLVLRADRPNISPVNDPIGAVVWGMDTSNIDWVFVSGEPLMREGRLVADVPDIRERALAAQARVATASGTLAEAGAVS